MRLDHYIVDSVEAGQDIRSSMALFEDAIANIKKYDLWNDPIVWRGFGVKVMYGWIVKVSNNREGFRGALSDVAREIIGALNLDTPPIFTTKHYSNARFFGRPRAFVPCGPFKTYVNPNVKDIMDVSRRTTIHYSDKVEERYPRDPDEVAKEYIETKNDFPDVPAGEWQEMIVTAKEYYLLYPDSFFELTKKSKFATIKSIDDIKKYGDIVKLYNEWISYVRWFVSMRAKENPNIVGTYVKDGYPEEWFK